MEKLIITAATAARRVTKKHNPAVPYTVEGDGAGGRRALLRRARRSSTSMSARTTAPTQDRERFRVVDAHQGGLPLA